MLSDFHRSAVYPLWDLPPWFGSSLNSIKYVFKVLKRVRNQITFPFLTITVLCQTDADCGNSGSKPVFSVAKCRKCGISRKHNYSTPWIQTIYEIWMCSQLQNISGLLAFRLPISLSSFGLLWILFYHCLLLSPSDKINSISHKWDYKQGTLFHLLIDLKILLYSRSRKLLPVWYNFG